MTIIDRVEAKGAALRVLAMQLDTGTPTGKLMLNVLGSVAQFEREVMLERQREGIARAKAEKKYKGRAPTARAKAAEVHPLAAGGMSKAKIASELGIKVAETELVCGSIWLRWRVDRVIHELDLPQPGLPFASLR